MDKRTKRPSGKTGTPTRGRAAAKPRAPAKKAYTKAKALEEAKGPWRKLPERIRAARLARELTQMDVSLAMGRKGNSWLAQVEKGIHIPSLNDLERLGAVLHKSVAWLLFGRNLGGGAGKDAEKSIPDALASDHGLLRLDPGQWEPGPQAPPQGHVLLVSPKVHAGSAWLVWRGPGGFQVAWGTYSSHAGAFVLQFGTDVRRPVTPVGRVVLTFDPKA